MGFPPPPPSSTRRANIAVSREAIAISDTFRCPGRRVCCAEFARGDDDNVSRGATDTAAGIALARGIRFHLIKTEKGKSLCTYILYYVVYTDGRGRWGIAFRGYVRETSHSEGKTDLLI